MNSQEFKALTCYTVKSNVAGASISDKLKYLVLESDPTPGYYAKNNFPINKHVNDWHFYIPVKNQIVCFQDVILRNVPIINDKLKSNLRIYPGQIIFKNKNHAGIRVNTDNPDIMPAFIDELIGLGLKLFKDKKVEEYESVIYYKKFTGFINIGEGIYQDENNANRFFFEIPRQINFDDFLSGMERIKFSCDYHLFDSFLASIFIENSTQDFIGIYSEHCDKNRFAELKEEIVKVFK
ncbi:MAG: hypothetical protein DRJ01_17395 [Bacteroidetes bacterium]|nr:MAG: hypothetical protein DRJ01_17395 [Bacteroidota bacterium]